MVYTLHYFLFKMQFVFIILTYLVPVFFTFYIQDVLKLKKNNSGSKRLRLYIFFSFEPLFNALDFISAPHE